MHKKFMQVALEEAQIAFDKGEVPVGAVIVKDNEIIAKAHNLKETLHDPTAHAEIIALRSASAIMDTWYLADATLYVTLEPCPMCAGAIIQARMRRLVYGAMDIKAGAAGSLMNIVEDKRFNHQVEVIAGIMEIESKNILQKFFSQKRNL